MTKKQNYHTIRYGNKDGELKFGHINDNNQLDAFIVRSGVDPNHYIEMCSTGEPHLKNGTICRSTGSFQVKAGDNVPKDQPGVYIDSQNGDLVLISRGRIRIEAKNVDIIASGGDGKNGVVSINANEKIIIDSKGSIKIKSTVETTIVSEKTLNVIGKGILDIYGGLIDAADGATSIKGSKGGSVNEEKNKK